MAYTQTQIDALEAAIATGVLTVRHGDTSTTFRSMAEMKEALRMAKADVNETPRTTVAAFRRGAY